MFEPMALYTYFWSFLAKFWPKILHKTEGKTPWNKGWNYNLEKSVLRIYSSPASAPPSCPTLKCQLALVSVSVLGDFGGFWWLKHWGNSEHVGIQPLIPNGNVNPAPPERRDSAAKIEIRKGAGSAFLNSMGMLLLLRKRKVGFVLLLKWNSQFEYFPLDETLKKLIPGCQCQWWES